MNRFRHLFQVVYFCLRAGCTAQDKLALLRFMLRYLLVNRRLASHQGATRAVNCSLHGRSFTVHLRDNGTDATIFDDLFVNECYRPRFNIEPPAVIYDAGANIGLASHYFSLMYPDARIISFEPVEHEMCARNLAEQRMQLIKCALGKENGTCNILLDPRNSGGHRLELYDEHSTLQRVIVPLRRLDALIAQENLPPPDLLKIDAEGAECDILAGLGEHITTLKVLLAEVQSPVNHQWIIAFLKQHGFKNIAEEILHPNAREAHESYSLIQATRD